jgi:hypothetical protein
MKSLIRQTGAFTLKLAMPKTVLLSNGFSFASPAFQQAELYGNCTMDRLFLKYPPKGSYVVAYTQSYFTAVGG